MTWLWSWWCVIFRYVALYELSGPAEPRGAKGAIAPLYFASHMSKKHFINMIVCFCLSIHIFKPSNGPALYERSFYAEIPWLLAKLILYWLRYISTILYNRKSNFELYTKSFTLINLRIVMYVSFYFIFQIKSDYSFRFCLHDLYLCISRAFHKRGGGAWGSCRDQGGNWRPQFLASIESKHSS